MSWLVKCDDGEVRHRRPFRTMTEAETFAWFGHVCLAKHTYEEVGTDGAHRNEEPRT